jgi:undecaprenyl-diphosphatase
VTGTTPPRRRLARFAVGLGLFLVTREEARRNVVPAYEERIFRAANDAPEAIRAPVRTLMQAGTLGTIPAAALVAAVVGRRRLATSILIGGSIAWFGAKLAKPYGGRPRPAALLDDVAIREPITGDLGWVSGHAAVATTLAFTLGDTLPRWTTPILAGVVVATGYGRMYVGAHLPADIVGGVGLGMLISAALPEP